MSVAGLMEGGHEWSPATPLRNSLVQFQRHAGLPGSTRRS
jgi:hypothetical protein